MKGLIKSYKCDRLQISESFLFCFETSFQECNCIAGNFGKVQFWLYWRLGSIAPNLNTAIWPASHEKGPSDISHSVDQDQPLYKLKTHKHNKIVYKSSKFSAIDVMIVKKCRPWPDAASKTRWLVWVYTFCICPKVPFRMRLAIYLKSHPNDWWSGEWNV